MNNLAGDSQYDTVIDDLKGKLQDWMDRQGDEGLATEVNADQRLWRNAPRRRR